MEVKGLYEKLAALQRMCRSLGNSPPGHKQNEKLEKLFSLDSLLNRTMNHYKI